MKIAFDSQIFSLQPYGGISRYFCSLVSALHELNQEPHIFAPAHRNNYLSKLGSELQTGKLIKGLPPGTSQLLSTYSSFISSYKIQNWKPDIVHETYYALLPSRRLKKFPTVITVYDMIDELYSDQFPRREIIRHKKKSAIQRADHIICISENTRNDLIKFYDISHEKTSVIYLSSDEIFHDRTPPTTDKMIQDRPYFLFVGQRAGYKNFTNFIEAFSNSKFLNKDMDIVCFGGGSFTKAELNLFASLGLKKENIHFRSGDDLVLKTLYRQAEALIYPSLYEGFGIPPLEAMASGCAVIASHSSSIPEVVGEAGEYVHPNDIDSIKQALEQVVLQPCHKSTLINKGYEQYKKFSWNKCAHETLEVYKNLL